jgi:predicted MFS family arabinose efflux permease
MGVLVITGLTGQPGGVLIVMGFASGIVLPPTSAVARRALAQEASARRDLLPSVFALESLCAEVVFMGGPAITAVIILVASPAAALVTACGIAIVAVAGIVVVPTIEAQEPEEPSGRWGALRSAGMRTLIACVVPLGLLYGAFQVSVVAFSDDQGAPAAAPLMLAFVALGGAVGVFSWGAIGHRFSNAAALSIATCLLPFFFTPMLFPTSVAQMAALAVVSGVFLTPVLAITNQIVADVAPSDAVTESYAWVFMGMLSGASAGLIVGGKLVDSHGWRAGMALAVASTVVMAIVAVTRRRTLPDIGWEHVKTEAA